MERTPRPQPPFPESHPAMERLQEAGLVHTKYVFDATRRTIGSVACHIRQGIEVTTYNVAQCTGIRNDSNQAKIMRRLLADGLFGEATLTPPDPSKQRSRVRTVYVPVEAALPILAEFPTLPDCIKCPLRPDQQATPPQS